MAPSGLGNCRILHVLNPELIGGIETVFLSYLDSTRDRRLDHHMMARGRLPHEFFSTKVRDRVRSFSLAHYWRQIKLPPRPKFFRSARAKRIMRAISPDVILLHNGIGNSAIWELSLGSGADVVYYDHGAAWTETPRPRLLDSLARAKGVICCSDASRRTLEERWGVARGTARVILNCFPAYFKSKKIKPRRLPTDRPIRIGAAGQLRPGKGLFLTLHALKHLRAKGFDCMLQVAGTGPYLGDLRRLADRLGIASQVSFNGLLRDIGAFFSEIDVFVHPSIHEALGNVCIEAGYFGCPSVVSAVDGLPESVRDGVTGFCIEPTLLSSEYERLMGDAVELRTNFDMVYLPATDSFIRPKLVDPKEIAERIVVLCEHPEAYGEMSVAAHKWTSAIFHPEVYARDLDSILCEAALRHRGISSFPSSSDVGEPDPRTVVPQ